MASTPGLRIKAIWRGKCVTTFIHCDECGDLPVNLDFDGPPETRVLAFAVDLVAQEHARTHE